MFADTSAGTVVRWIAASSERWHQFAGPSVPGSYEPAPSPEISESPIDTSEVFRAAIGRTSGLPYSLVASAARTCSRSAGSGVDAAASVAPVVVVAAFAEGAASAEGQGRGRCDRAGSQP